LASIDTEIDRLKTLFTSGLFTLQEIARDKKRLDISRTEIEKQIAEVDGRLSSLGGSPDIAEKLLERVRALKQKTAILTDGGKREIIELLDTDVILYTKDQAPWCHIEVSFTVQRADLPIRSIGNGPSRSGKQPEAPIMSQDTYVLRPAFRRAKSSSRLCRDSSA
jgi:hypothetical protein